VNSPGEDDVKQRDAASRFKGEQEVSKSSEFKEGSSGGLNVTSDSVANQLLPSERRSYEHADVSTTSENHVASTGRPSIHWGWILFIVVLYTFIFFSGGYFGTSLYQNAESGSVGLATNYAMKAIEVLSLPVGAIVVIILFEFVVGRMRPTSSFRQAKTHGPQQMEKYSHPRSGAELAEAQNLFAQKHYAEAIKTYDRWIGETPNQPELYDNRGFCYEALQQNQTASKDFDKAISVAPTASTYSCRGRFYTLVGEYQKAIDDFTKSIELAPSDGNIRRDRSRAYKKLGKPDLAQKDLDVADAPYNSAK
jgi:tetratricopeptide (TPR) repeat protein